MTPLQDYVENLKICDRFRLLEGDIAECGTWKGGMIAGMAEVLGDNNRTYFLFDSFEGLPEAKPIDGEAALKWQRNTESETYHNNCKAELSDAREAMSLSGIQNFQIIKGWFHDTLPSFNSENKIAVLRLDGDWYESISECLKYLYPLVIKNGLIIIDDYYVWDGVAKAVHHYLNEINSAAKIYTLCNGIAYIIKKE
jgi:O-methyltransferase